MYETIRTHEHLLAAFQRAEETYDPIMAHHSVRVANTAVLMGKTIGMSDADLTVAAWVGNLHDIGKLGVAESIIQKRGTLTNDEWVEMRQHPLIGEAIIVAMSPKLEPIAKAVRGHHERWDGLGYPDGIAGEEIPLMARLIAIADTYDALTHMLPYRSKVFTTQDALNTILVGSGEQYDPTLTDAFEKIHEVIRNDDSAKRKSLIRNFISQRQQPR